MGMISIQSKLDEMTEQQAAADFKRATQQAYALLAPFFEPLQYTEYRSEENIDKCNAMLTDMFNITKHGRMYLKDDGLSVPDVYVADKKRKASLEFIDKVEKLQEQIDELYGSVGN